jgi:hypothetical protein
LVLAAEVAVGQRLPGDHPQVLVQAGLEDALLGRPVQAVIADLDDAHTEPAGAPGLVEVVTGEGEAEVSDRASGHLLVERLPEAVVVDVLVGAECS